MINLLFSCAGDIPETPGRGGTYHLHYKNGLPRTV
jgi:hypothetical protein